MINHTVLLLEGNSVSHTPPQDILSFEQFGGELYSKKLNQCTANFLSEKVVNKNAMTKNFCSNFGLLMLSTLLKQHGYGVLYDNGDYYRDFEEFKNCIIQKVLNCEVVCLTATTPQFNQILQLCKFIKEINPSVMTFVGGPHIYHLTSNTYNGLIDVICKGADISCVSDAINSYFKDGEVSQNFISSECYFDIQKDFSIIPPDKIGNTLLYSYLSYGCPNKCKYCLEHKLSNKVVFNSIDDKIIEIQSLVDDFGVKFIHLCDSDLFLNLQYLDVFLDKLEASGINACFSCNTCPNTVIRNDVTNRIARFIKLGLIEIMIGVEHCSYNVLSHLSKNYDLKKLTETLCVLKSNFNLPIVSLYTMVGLPFELHSDISINIDMLHKMKEMGAYDFTFPKFFVPYPGTDIFNNPERYNVKIVSYNWDDYHRWCLPRPIEIFGMSDDDYLSEIMEIDKLNGIA